MTVPPHNLEAEMSALGAVLISDRVLPRLLVEEGLKPDHFYREHHRHAWAAMTGLFERGEGIDPLTVASELDRRGLGDDEWPARLDALAGAVPSVAHAREYARRVVELALLRQKLAGAYEIIAGVEERDRERISTGEGMLVSETVASATSTPDELAADLLERYAPGREVELFPFPFERLTLYSGGMRRGGVTLLGGHSSHGKTTFLDQILDGVAKRANVHLYINEMTRAERMDRYAARHSGVDLARLRMGRIEAHEYPKLAEAAKTLRYGITDAAELGGAVEEVAHHVRATSPDLVGVDILHLFDHDEERDLARISRTLNRLAKVANCHVLATVHLNEKRVVGAVRTPPTLGDIRGSGMLKNDADQVLFVHRDQTEDGTELLDTGRIYFAKARHGVLGGVPVLFDGRHTRFTLDDTTAHGPTPERNPHEGSTTA